MSYVLVLIILGVHTTAITKVEFPTESLCEQAKKKFIEESRDRLPERQATCLKGGK